MVNAAVLSMIETEGPFWLEAAEQITEAADDARTGGRLESIRVMANLFRRVKLAMELATDTPNSETLVALMRAIRRVLDYRMENRDLMVFVGIWREQDRDKQFTSNN